MKYKDDGKSLNYIIPLGHGVIEVYGYRNELFRPGEKDRQYSVQTYTSIRTMTPSTVEDGVEMRAESTYVNLKLEDLDQLILALSDQRERMKPKETADGTR